MDSSLKEGSLLPFDEFVEFALYDPKSGYYTAKRLSDGPAEDFITAPEMGELFAKVLARFIKKRADELSLPLKILELGAGKGFLAESLFKLLKPSGYVALEKRKRPPSLRKEIEWINSLSELKVPFSGVVIANEFFDAFPFKRIKKIGGKLYEVFIRVERGGFAEELFPFDGELPCQIGEGAEYALFTGWEEFLTELRKGLEKALFVIVDYGWECRELANRTSFRAYREGKLCEDYLNFVGSCDLTAWVDFSYLKEVLRRSGFSQISCQPLSRFLLSWGVEEVVEPAEIAEALSLLVDMGRKFRVLTARLD